jgi:hypothetical protein
LTTCAGSSVTLGIGPKTLAGIKPYLLPMADDENLAGR